MQKSTLNGLTLLLLAALLTACGAPQPAELAPTVTGPALLFFYTNN